MKNKELTRIEQIEGRLQEIIERLNIQISRLQNKRDALFEFLGELGRLK